MTNNANDDAPVFNMGAALAKFGPKVDSRKGARKARQKKLSGATDGRSLRNTGRTQQMNIRYKPEIVEALEKHVPKGAKSLWMEEAIIAKLKAEGYEIDG